MIRTAIVGRRSDAGEPDTTEIARLFEATGGRVVGAVTQVRPEVPATHFGPGKVEEIADRLAQSGADGFVVDNPLAPTQAVNLETAIGRPVLDRHRVVLEIFAERAHSRRAQLQIELARLRYELPRVRELDDPQPMNVAQEKGYRLKDLRDRIDRLERKLDAEFAPGDQRRERRREAGFDLVAIAGYTNAGKSTLLRRLADDLSLEAVGHADLSETAAVEDRLFETLETTTRRATLGGRKVLLTDTVGFLDDLPHWLVESFRGTLAAVEASDAVVLVADVSQSAEELQRKLRTALENVPDAVPIVPVLNKADAVPDAVVRERVSAVEGLLADPVVTSVREADTLDELEARVVESLPGLVVDEHTLPLTDDVMSVLSWLHDEAAAVDADYGPESVTLTVEAKPAVHSRARSRIAEL